MYSLVAWMRGLDRVRITMSLWRGFEVIEPAGDRPHDHNQYKQRVSYLEQ
jgi:hypothetical protein